MMNPDGSYTQTEFMFRSLTAEEVKQFQQWARDNYTPGEEVQHGVFHPVLCAECELMNEEAKS